MPAAPGPDRNPAKLPATIGWHPPPAQDAVAPTPPVENSGPSRLAVPESEYTALVKPTCRLLSETCAVVKLTATRPPDSKLPTSPVAESVGRVPPTGAYSTMPAVGRSVATTPWM